MTKKKVTQRIAGIDYFLLARNFIKELRGDLGQRALSESLGYTFNKVGKWENGVTQIKWNDFIDIADQLELNHTAKLKKFFGNYDGHYDFKQIYHYLDLFFGLEVVTDPLIQRLRKKWQQKSAAADLAEVLKVFDTRPAMLIGFLSEFVDCSQFDQLKERYQQFLQALDILCDDPVIGNITEALKVDDYLSLDKHDDQLLASHAGISCESLQTALKKHLQLGTLYYDGTKYHPTHLNFSFSHLNVRKLRSFNKFCFRFMADNYQVHPRHHDREYIYNAGCTSNRVVALSPQAAQAVSQLISKFHSEVSEIVENDKQIKKNVQMINLASVPVSVGQDPTNDEI